MMGDFGNAIKYLYRQLILRDILSFVMPGAIVVLTAFLVFIAEPTLEVSLEKLFKYPSSIHWLFYILIFGLFYLVGFAVQCLGELFKVISFSPPDIYRWPIKERLNIFGTHWTRDKDTVWWNDYYKRIEKFWKLTRSDEEAQQRRERLIVLKQMCATNFLAVVISGIFILINQYLCASSWCLLILVIPLLVSLFWGQRVHVLRQYSREKIIISSRQVKK